MPFAICSPALLLTFLSLQILPLPPVPQLPFSCLLPHLTFPIHLHTRSTYPLPDCQACHALQRFSTCLILPSYLISCLITGLKIFAYSLWFCLPVLPLCLVLNPCLFLDLIKRFWTFTLLTVSEFMLHGFCESLHKCTLVMISTMEFVCWILIEIPIYYIQTMWHQFWNRPLIALG